jgi:L-rhamnose mutarotase
MLIGLRPEAEREYREIHAKVWPAVLETIRQCNIRNYSIFLNNGQLFAYFEYHGTDYEADMAKMAADPTTKRWWAITEPMQVPLPGRKPGAWWLEMDEVFHTE